MPKRGPEGFKKPLICPRDGPDYFPRTALEEGRVQLAFGDYVLDSGRRELRRNSEQIALEPQVFDLLLYLVQNGDRVVTKDDLIAAVWNGRIVSDSTLTTRINAARKAIGDSGGQQNLIKTYPRKGIRFVGEVRDDGEGSAEPPEQPQIASAVSVRSHAEPVTNKAAAPARPDGVLDWGKPCVAVLPFNNLSGDPQQEYFSDGITEDIITALSKYRSLVVIARNSSFAFKGAADVRQVGMTLGAEYLVKGSVRKIGQRLRITAQLVETEGGRHLWAERYDRDLQDLFQLQDEITTAIAARIEPEVGAAERLRVERKAVPALHAWDFFRLGTKHFYKSTAADNLEAQRLFRRAIELDPNLAEAYGYLSYAIVLSMVYFDAEPNEERLNEAREIGKKGVELDDQDGLIRFMYGRALLAQKAYGDALAELETAVELNPCLAVSYCGLGDSLAYEGRISEAIPYFQKAIDLSPYDPLRWAFYSYRALAHLFGREFDLAFEWALKATRVPNAHYWAFAHRVSALGHLQRPEDLRVAVDELLQRKPDFSCSFARKRLFYVKDPDQLELYIEGLGRAGIPE
jgi:TolB-like protein/DNA-binding winged helix-turn-helix (wHTH) protein